MRAGRDMARGAMTIDDFVFVNSYVFTVVAPMEWVGLALREMAQGMPLIDRLLALLHERPELLEQKPMAEPVQHRPQPAAELLFERVNFCYRPGRPILQDLTLRLPAGRWW